MSNAETSYTSNYVLYIYPTNDVTATISLQQYDENNYFTVAEKKIGAIVQESYYKGDVLSFTLTTDHEYCSALVEVSYPPTSLNPSGVSYGHIYFKPDGKASGGAQWYWDIDPNVPGDNLSIFIPDKDPATSKNIRLQVPTQPNPNVLPTNFPCLQESLVFLLDIQGKNLLFRGNEPLAPSTGAQTIDFSALHNALSIQYQAQTGNPFPYKPGAYVLRDIAFLGPDEFPILRSELSSFGGTSIKLDLADQAWYPKAPATLPAPQLTPPHILGQISNWNLLPSGVVPPASPTSADINLNLDVRFVKQLKEWMNETNTLPHVYYIHCSSGHDRTGIASAGYLVAQYSSMSLSKAFIKGTTINLLPAYAGGNLVQYCFDTELSPPSIDPSRSRCFVAGTTYNNTIIDIFNVLRTQSETELSAEATSGDPALGASNPPGKPTEPGAYVCDDYPWSA